MNICMFKRVQRSNIIFTGSAVPPVSNSLERLAKSEQVDVPMPQWGIIEHS